MSDTSEILALIADEAISHNVIMNMPVKQMQIALLSIRQKIGQLQHGMINESGGDYLLDLADNYIQLRDHINEVIHG